MNDDFHNQDCNKIEDYNLLDTVQLSIDKELPYDKRMRLLINELKDPYYYTINNTAVHLCYNENGSAMEKLLIDYLRRQNYDD